MKRTAVYLILMVLSGMGCSMVGRKNIPDGPVEHSVILSGSHSMIDSANVILVTNQDNWEKTWRESMGNQEPLPKIPTVDFSRQYVIAAFMGQRNSSGYRIEITSVAKKGQVLKVTVKKYETPGMLTVITNPFTLERIPRGNYKLEVEEETAQ